MCLDFGRKVRAGHMDLGVTSMEMAFDTKGLYEITRGMSTGRKEKGSRSTEHADQHLHTVLIPFRLGSLSPWAKRADSKDPTMSDPSCTPERLTLIIARKEEMDKVRERKNQLLAVPIYPKALED